MPCTRTRRRLCRKGSPVQSPVGEQHDDPSRMTVITNLKHEVLELQRLLDLEREQRLEILRERKELSSTLPLAVEKSAKTSLGNTSDDAHECLTRELQMCRKELAATREALDEAREEREAFRVELSYRQTAEKKKEDRCDESRVQYEHPHLDWVGRHFLAVTLSEDHMFKPGQSVTPAGVLHKLFEMRVGCKLATGFSVLLENINIMLSQMEPEWYAKHFGFCGKARTHGNCYKSTNRVETEEFAWLLFEYGAHAPLIEVLAGLQTVLNSTGKGGVTTVALCTSKTVYSSYAALFRETVSNSFERFARVRERAYKARREQGLIYVPLNAGLGADQSESQAESHSVRSRALRSVIEGIGAPAPLSSASVNDRANGASQREDPFRLEHSLSEFLERRRVNTRSKEGRTPVDNTGHLPFKALTPPMSAGPLEQRVLFEAPWPNPVPESRTTESCAQPSV